MFICEFCKVFKNIFRQKHLCMTNSCVYLNFEKFFRSPLLQSTSGKLLISFTSCPISTFTYSKKWFNSKKVINAFQAFILEVELGVHVLKIPKKYLWRSYFIMKLRDANLPVNKKKHFQTSSFMHFAFIFLEYTITISSRKYKRKVVIYLFNDDSSKGKDTLWIFLSEYFMKYSSRVISWNMKYCSWNTFTLVSNIHCVCFSPIKKLCLQRKDIV